MWDILLQIFERIVCFCSEEEGRLFFRRIGKDLLNYMILHLRKHHPWTESCYKGKMNAWSPLCDHVIHTGIWSGASSGLSYFVKNRTEVTRWITWHSFGDVSANARCSALRIPLLYPRFSVFLEYSINKDNALCFSY